MFHISKGGLGIVPINIRYDTDTLHDQNPPNPSSRIAFPKEICNLEVLTVHFGSAVIAQVPRARRDVGAGPRQGIVGMAVPSLARREEGGRVAERYVQKQLQLEMWGSSCLGAGA